MGHSTVRGSPTTRFDEGLAPSGWSRFADGHQEPMEFEIDIPRSAWVAVRIFPSVHTNPVWVEVAGQPVRASRQSAQWCLDAVDVCWEAKRGRIRQSEQAAAAAAYEQARTVYRPVLAEAQVD